MPLYPSDADGDALRRVAEHGSDMSKSMDVEFAIRVPDQSAGQTISDLAMQRGYACHLWQSDEGNWDCICTRNMVLTYDEVVAAQRELNDLARPYGGHIDGWGTFGNAEAV
jgi:Regulator of ribonuclease activity B